MQFDEFDSFTRKLCVETREIILSVYESPDMEVEIKSDESPVTYADKKTERVIREAIQNLYPAHGIKGEEYGDINPDAPWTWVIDPIDGTKTFTVGCPLFGTMIGLLHEGEPRFGAIDFPALDKRITGDCQLALVNGTAVRATQGKPLSESIAITTDYGDIARHQNGAAFETLAGRVRYTRTWGDCYGYYLLATGNADIMLDPIMSFWDIMALIPIVKGSGARITDWQGGDPARGDSIVAANSDLHDQVLSTLNA